MHYRTVAGIVVLAFSLSLVGGCGEKKAAVKTVEVSGTVYLDGKPLASVEIDFVGKDYAGHVATGPDGKYQTRAQPGDNKMKFTKVKGAGTEGGPDVGQMEAAAASMGGGAAVAKMLELPGRYADVSTSGVAFNVPDSGATDVDFKLSSK
jgi:hypothetical protein